MTDLTTLQAQAHRLIQTAPDHGISVAAMQQVGAMLIQVAQQLDHSSYTLLRYPDQSWFLMPQPVQPGAAETSLWLPAFAASADADVVQQEVAEVAPDLQAHTLEVVELLFNGLGLRRAQGILFYEQPGHSDWGKSVLRQDLQQRLRQTLQSSIQDPIA